MRTAFCLVFPNVPSAVWVEFCRTVANPRFPDAIHDEEHGARIIRGSHEGKGRDRQAVRDIEHEFRARFGVDPIAATRDLSTQQ